MSEGHPAGRTVVALAVAAWLLLVVGGTAALWKYKLTPGAAAAQSERWPAASRLHRDAARPTLVMLAHPHCPCTRASVGELARLLTALGDRVAAHVVFVRPPGVPLLWERTDVWRSASDIPGVRIWADEGGVEADRFGAWTSGQVFLYGADGARLFAGGITPARGHHGDSAGRSAILALVAGASDAPERSAVFGCPVM